MAHAEGTDLPHSHDMDTSDQIYTPSGSKSPCQTLFWIRNAHHPRYGRRRYPRESDCEMQLELYVARAVAHMLGNVKYVVSALYQRWATPRMSRGAGADDDDNLGIGVNAEQCTETIGCEPRTQVNEYHLSQKCRYHGYSTETINPWRPEVFILKFSPTWICVSLTRSTASSEWK